MGGLGVLAERGLVREIGIAARAVGDEHQVELAALRRSREAFIVLEIMPRIGVGIGMQPGRDVMAGRLKEGAKTKLAICGHAVILSLRA